MALGGEGVNIEGGGFVRVSEWGVTLNKWVSLFRPALGGELASDGTAVGQLYDFDVLQEAFASEASEVGLQIDLQGVVTGTAVDHVTRIQGASRREGGNHTLDGIVTVGAFNGLRTLSEHNSQLLCNPFLSQRLTRVLKPPKRPLPTTFLPQKTYFQSLRIFYLSYQTLSRATYLYSSESAVDRPTNVLPVT